jgi:hypothetical protein
MVRKEKACQLKSKWQKSGNNKFPFGKDLLRARLLATESPHKQRKTIRAKCEREHVYQTEKNISREEKDEITKEENENIHLKSLRERTQGFLLIGFSDFCVVRLFRLFL